jgi:hypothetical protein
MWNNTEEPDRPQMTIWRMRIACWSLFVLQLSNSYQVKQLFGCRNSQNMYIRERQDFDIRRKFIKNIDAKITVPSLIRCYI